MRLLHTSDWHLGRSFHGASLLEEQAAAIERIAELAAEHAVDAVLIAGDLYDRAIPPAEAVALFNHALARLSANGTAVIAIAGNHDSHVRVSVYDPLLSAFGVTIRGDVGRAHEPVLVTPRAGGTPVAIYPLPYLEPAVDGPALAGEPVRLRHEEVTRLALARIRADLQGRPGHRSVLVAHTFVAGGESSESERELTIGNVDRVSLAAFARLRLRGPGPPAPPPGAGRPAGGLLRHPAGLLLLRAAPRQIGADRGAGRGRHPFGAGGAPGGGPAPVHPHRSDRGALHDPRHAAAAGARVRAILTDETLPLQAMARLRSRFPHIAELRHEPPEVARAGSVERHRQVRQARSPLELAGAFFADQQGRPASAAEADLLQAALVAAARGGER